MNTGPGGANVWPQEWLFNLIGDPLKQLGSGFAMRVAIRRAFRVLEHEGMPENLGAVMDYKHDMTIDDVLKDNVYLFIHIANIMSNMPIYIILVIIPR